MSLWECLWLAPWDPRGHQATSSGISRQFGAQTIEEAPGGTAASWFTEQNSSSKRAGRSLKAGKQAPTRVCPPQLLLAGPAGWVGTDTRAGRGPGDEGRAEGAVCHPGSSSRCSPFSRPSRSSCCCSVAQSCPALCDPMDCSTPGLPVHHQLLEFTQTRPLSR